MLIYIVNQPDNFILEKICVPIVNYLNIYIGTKTLYLDYI